MPALQMTRNPRATLDLIERVVIVALYLWLLLRFADGLSGQPANLIFLFSEGVVMMMVLLRRATDQISIRPLDWAVGFAGTLAVMLVVPATPLPGVQVVVPVLMLTGLGVSLAAKLQLRRSFGIVAAHRGLKTRGVYALVRHPMYAGYFLINSGMLLANFSAWNAAVIAVWTGFQLMRIAAEERILARDADYAAHMTKVRFRLIPGLY